MNENDDDKKKHTLGVAISGGFGFLERKKGKGKGKLDWSRFLGWPLWFLHDVVFFCLGGVSAMKNTQDVFSPICLFGEWVLLAPSFLLSPLLSPAAAHWSFRVFFLNIFLDGRMNVGGQHSYCILYGLGCHKYSVWIKQSRDIGLGVGHDANFDDRDEGSALR